MGFGSMSCLVGLQCRQTVSGKNLENAKQWKNGAEIGTTQKHFTQKHILV